MKEEIKELASDNVLMTAYLILVEIRELKANLSLELQAVRDDRRAQLKEFQEFMAELRDSLTRIQAQFKVEAQLLNLVGRRNLGTEAMAKSKSISLKEVKETAKHLLSLKDDNMIDVAMAVYVANKFPFTFRLPGKYILNKYLN